MHKRQTLIFTKFCNDLCCCFFCELITSFFYDLNHILTYCCICYIHLLLFQLCLPDLDRIFRTNEREHIVGLYILRLKICFYFCMCVQGKNISKVSPQFFYPCFMSLSKNLCQKELYESVIKNSTKLNTSYFTCVWSPLRFEFEQVALVKKK